MDRVYGEPFGFDCPLFADDLIGGKAFDGHQPSPEIVGADEVGKVISQMVVVVVVEAFDRRFFDRAVHPFDLAIRPRMNRPGFAVDPIIRITRPYRMCSGLHGMPPLLQPVGYSRWVQAGGSG